MPCFNVAILGAECTGKSTLVTTLVARLQADGTAAQCIPEYLREWCDVNRRTPRPHDQVHIASVQAQRLATAVASATEGSIVVADTTPLMTAVYSEVYFKDVSLYPYALEQQRNFALTLLTGLDIAWVPDGIQRDSETVRKAVDHRLREVLTQHQIPFTTLYGQGNARTDAALQAIAYQTAGPRTGPQSDWKWTCDKCSDADCEHRMFSRLI